MIAPFANIFGYVLNFIYNIVNNYGIAIIIFSILVKLLMIPVSIKQQKTLKKSTKIQAKMKEIQFKYKNNPEMLNQATMELYKTEKMSPFSGCFTAIVQIILLFAVFYLVRSPLTYMKKIDEGTINKYTTIIKQNELSTSSAYPEIEIIRELNNLRQLKQNDQTTENTEQQTENNNAENENSETEENKEEKIAISEINEEELDSMYINMEFLGLDLAQVPTGSSDWKAYIIPILYVLVAVISLRITNPTKKKKDEEKTTADENAEMDPMAQMNKNMNIMFPFMYLAVALVAPLGLALYWLMNSLLMIVEKLALNKLIKDEEE